MLFTFSNRFFCFVLFFSLENILLLQIWSFSVPFLHLSKIRFNCINSSILNGILVEIDIIYVVYLIRTETKKMSRQNIWSEQNKFYTLTFGIPCLFFIQFCSWIDFAVMHLKIQYNLCLLFKHIIQLIGSKFMISDKFLVLIMWFKAFTQTKKIKYMELLSIHVMMFWLKDRCFTKQLESAHECDWSDDNDDKNN